jgi:methylation protein EvaC
MKLKEQCKSCGIAIKPFMKFGKMPIANAFYNKSEYNNQYFYDMDVCFCDSCFVFQLLNIPKPKKMFHKNYAYFASTSKFMQNHWSNLAKSIKRNNNNNVIKLIIDIGSNDGIFLKNFVNNKNWLPIGIEPSINVANFSKKKGLKNVINDFFNYKLSKTIYKKYKKKAQIIVSTNTMHHIENTNSVFLGVKNILNDDGQFITEDPSLYEMIKKGSYDQIYAEHMYIWSAISLDLMAKKHGLFLFDLQNNKVHGGCTRYFFCHNDMFKRTRRCTNFITKEINLGLNNIKTYLNFKNNALAHSKSLYNLIKQLKLRGNKICCYTSPAKGTTMINYAKLDISLIDKVFDNTKSKIGKFIPGKNKIPVFSTNKFRNERYDYILLLAWNHKEEVLIKERDFTTKIGSKWIIPMPKIKIIS